LPIPAGWLGCTFFNPVAQLPLVEVVHGEGTREGGGAQGVHLRRRDQQIATRGEELSGLPRQPRARALPDGSVRRYQLGEPREKIDQAALKFGMPMGPLELMDLVGLDIANHVGEELRLAPGTDNVLASLGAARQARQENRRRILRVGEGQA
jgi:3-hydroxyacyl-CoA dehydrogenase/enoyl-CoA hydratase/3-hydroxybutyryl-CoA epimerase